MMSRRERRARVLLATVLLANSTILRRTLYRICSLRIYLSSISEGPRPPRSIETLRIQRGSTCYLKITMTTSSH